MLSATERLAFGDLAKTGLRRRGGNALAASGLASEHVAPAVDRGFVDAVKRGKIAVRPEIRRLERAHIVFVNGESMSADIVICATGYRCGLESMVGHLGVLRRDGRPACYGEPVLDGLWFALMPPPLGGSLRAISRAIRPMARSIAIEGRAVSARRFGAGPFSTPDASVS